MQTDAEILTAKPHTCPIDELYLITPEYLTPYLNFVKENPRLFRTGLENAAVLHLDDSYAGLLRYVIEPILDRYGVPQWERPYIMTFHISGLMAIILQWLKEDCATPVGEIVGLIQRCIRQK